MFGSRGTPGIGVLLALAIGFILLVGEGDDGNRESGGPRERTGPATEKPGERREQARPGRLGGTPAMVTRIVDGDTVEVALPGGVQDVRYIGIDTPESVAPGQPVECFAKRASAFNERLVAGERVVLVFDDERRDRYGRLLAYVHVGRVFVNAELVRRGFARTLTILPNTDHLELFDRLEQRAGNAGRGLWSACAP